MSHFALPADAPDILVNLLARWQDASDDHPPMPQDLVFDDLVDAHTGLFWVETTPKGAKKFDLKILRLGPEQTQKNPAAREGGYYSEFEVPYILARAAIVYRQTLETGTPHYWQMVNATYGRPPVQYVRLLMPLYDANGVASSLLGSTIWTED